MPLGVAPAIGPVTVKLESRYKVRQCLGLDLHWAIEIIFIAAMRLDTTHVVAGPAKVGSMESERGTRRYAASPLKEIMVAETRSVLAM